MKKIAVLVLTMVTVVVSGCATSQKTAVHTWNLAGDKVIYFEQSDRIPKDVLLAKFNQKEPAVETLKAIPPGAIAAVIKEILTVVPELSKNYSQERMFNALIGRRMLFKGYSGEDLIEINKIIKSMGGAIEVIGDQKDKE